MKQSSIFVLISGLLILSAGCGKVPKSGKATLKNNADSISYALGYLEANGWVMRFKEAPFDSVDLKTMARGFANSLMSKTYVERRIDQFGGFNEEVFVTAFINKLAYDKSYFDEFSADMLLRTSFERERAKKDVANKVKWEENLERGRAFLAENAKRPEVITLESGLQYEILVAGNGPKPELASNVKIHYHGTLIDGKVFDSSVERGEPIVHPANGFIPGWQEALQLMPVGSKWKLFIPSNLAYGENGAGGEIGPNETLIFEVELLGIE